MPGSFPLLPLALREALVRYGPGAVASVEQALPTLLRPCVWMDSRRAQLQPLVRSRLGSALGFHTAAPSLPLLRSKWGGIPYQEGAPVGSGWGFAGQLHFAELPDGLGLSGFPRQGLLALYLDQTASRPAARVQWFARPEEARARQTSSTRCIGRFEAALDFHPGWSPPSSDALDSLLPDAAEDVRDAWDEWTPGGFSDDRHHRLGGHRLDLDALTFFQPPPGGPEDLTQYVQWLRVTHDHAADFAWGTNWLYLFIHPEDLRAGRLERTAFALGNA